jgi:hypothetical protein
LQYVPDRRDSYVSAGFRIGAYNGRVSAQALRDDAGRPLYAALADPKMKARFADLGGTVLPGSPADLGKLIAAETEKWGKVVKFAGLKAD